MQKNDTDFRSDLARARGLGSAHHGVMHWWYQRVTAVAIIPLALWFVYSLVTAMLSPNVVTVAQWIAHPLNALSLALLLVASFIHAKLGMQVIIEDYIKCPCAKYALLLANGFVSYAAIGLGVLSIMKLHWLDVVAAVF